jgi:hypothetical protein
MNPREPEPNRPQPPSFNAADLVPESQFFHHLI